MSRPKKEEEDKRSEIIRVKLTKKEKEELRKEAKRHGISMSSTIRQKMLTGYIYIDDPWKKKEETL